jgi:hypothetical protein
LKPPSSPFTEESNTVMQKTMRAALIAAVLVGGSLPARAQTPWEDRAFVNLSFGVDTGSTEINENRSYPVYGETATLESTATFGSFGIFDIMVGARVWRNLGVGIDYHTGGTKGEGTISGSVPHPLFFDRPRTFTADFNDAKRDEHATHLQFGYMVPVNDKFDMYLFGGPSFFRVSQELVTDLAVTEQGPPFTAITVLPEIHTIKESATGYNLGVDATYFVYEKDQFRLGVGGMLRFTGATADLEYTTNTGERRTIETELGGVQFVFGGRVRF